MDSLTNNILFCIFSMTGVTNIIKNRRVCKKWRDYFDDSEDLWREIYQMYFSVDNPPSKLTAKEAVMRVYRGLRLIKETLKNPLSIPGSLVMSSLPIKCGGRHFFSKLLPQGLTIDSVSRKYVEYKGESKLEKSDARAVWSQYTSELLYSLKHIFYSDGINTIDFNWFKGKNMIMLSVSIPDPNIEYFNIKQAIMLVLHQYIKGVNEYDFLLHGSWDFMGLRIKIAYQ